MPTTSPFWDGAKPAQHPLTTPIIHLSPLLMDQRISFLTLLQSFRLPTAAAVCGANTHRFVTLILGRTPDDPAGNIR